MIWEAEMAVLAALSNICLAEDLSIKLEKDWSRSWRHLGIQCPSDPILIVTNEACFPRESSSLNSN